MTLPKQDDIDDPLLLLLFQTGGEGHSLYARQTYRPLAEFFDLTENERTAPRPNNQGPMWNSWVMMAKEQMKKCGFVVSIDHGRWQLTDAGRERARLLLQSPPAWLSRNPRAGCLGP